MNSSLIRRTVLVACCGCMTAANAEEKAFKLKQTIPLSGVEGRIDHFALDPSSERLFVCALGNNTVEVLDLRRGERIHSITGLGAPQGIAYIPEFDRLFVANDKDGIFKIYDAESFKALGELNFKDDADNVRYDEATKRIYVGFGSGGIAIVSAPDGKQIGSLKLSAHPEAFELEKDGKRTWHLGISRWRSTQRIIGCSLGAVFHQSLSSSTPNRATLLQRSTSPAIPTMYFAIISAIASTRSAAPGGST